MSCTLRRPHVPRLPTEVCEEIISFVAKGEWSQKTLRACTLVCRSWLPRSRIELFRYPHVEDKGICKFVDTVTTYPPLVVNAQELSLAVSRQSDPDNHAECVYRFFRDIIPLLQSITSLVYYNIPVPYLHLPFFSSGLKFLTSLELVYIEADSFGDFVRLVSFHKHLKELTICECSFGQPSVHQYSFAPRWGRDLQRLRFHICTYREISDVLCWLGRSNTSCSIRCLEIEYPTVSQQTVAPFVANCLVANWARSLQVVGLAFDNDFDDIGEAKEAVTCMLPPKVPITSVTNKSHK